MYLECIQERRRKAINTVRRQWEVLIAAKRRGKNSAAPPDLHASHVANFPNVDTPRDSSPDRLDSLPLFILICCCCFFFHKTNNT